MDFGAMIKGARMRKGLSQSGLARLLVTRKRPDGVWSTYIGQIEKGEKVPSEEICVKLAEVLDLDPVIVLLNSYSERADTPSARAFLDNLRVSVSETGMPSVSLDQEDARLEGAISALLDDREWSEIVAGLSRTGRIGQLPRLLDLAAGLEESEWEALRVLVSQEGGSRSDHSVRG